MNTIDYSAWKARYHDAVDAFEARAGELWRSYARDPAKLVRLQQFLIAICLLWSLISVSQLIWIPLRTDAIDAVPAAVANPPRLAGGGRSVVIDVSTVLGSGLFGAAPELPEAAMDDETVASGGREGIEANARETRLALTLTGIVASAEDGLGSAVIKAGASEQVFDVGDSLPASGRVVLAKVMAEQVVIDNNGTYELIKLYDKPGLSIPVQSAAPAASSGALGESRPRDTRAPVNDAQRSALAGQYRQQLYDNPESLTDVVSVAPVRSGDRVTGYRIAPGKDRKAFDAFGFKSGDIVTAVNGLALSDASNTVKLYQMMKDASQAAFDIERDGGNVTINVDLANP